MVSAAELLPGKALSDIEEDPVDIGNDCETLQPKACRPADRG